MSVGRPKLDITGNRFGCLVALSFSTRRPNGQSMWRCRCDCGTVKDVGLSGLRKGSSRSCGCRKHDCRTRHGMAHKTPEYNVWVKMRQRCNNANDKSYRDYGGRGITVCKRWSSFDAFYDDMGPRPSAQHSIERVNNALGYTKANCIWATRTTQNNNTRATRRITFDGKTLSLSEWADSLGVRRSVISQRLVRYGWTAERALTTPVRRWS